MPDRFAERITQLRDLGCAITEAATDTARAVIGQLPHLTVGVFPRDGGGVSLQVVTETRTVLVGITPDGQPVTGECAEASAYHEQDLWDRSDAVRWFKQFAPEEQAHA